MMAYTKQMADENRAIFEAAKTELEHICYDPDNEPSGIVLAMVAALKHQFPNITPSRLRHQINRVLMKKRGESWHSRPGAPIGNTNAARKDGQHRVHLTARVEQSTLVWLQQQADRETDGNIGRWLDKLAYSYS